MCCPSCRLEDSYKEFFVKGFDSTIDKECFTSEKYNFATINNVIIKPSVKEVVHGKYRVFISAYSKTGSEMVKIKKVIIKDEYAEVSTFDLDECITFKNDSDEIHKGNISVEFTEEEMEIFNDKKFSIVVLTELSSEDGFYSKEITFEISVTIYQSFVFPT